MKKKEEGKKKSVWVGTKGNSLYLPLQRVVFMKWGDVMKYAQRHNLEAVSYDFLGQRRWDLQHKVTKHTAGIHGIFEVEVMND